MVILLFADSFDAKGRRIEENDFIGAFENFGALEHGIMREFDAHCPFDSEFVEGRLYSFPPYGGTFLHAYRLRGKFMARDMRHS